MYNSAEIRKVVTFRMAAIQIRPAVEQDVSVVLQMIRDLAEYEKLSHAVVATEDRIRATLFAARPAADVLLAYREAECVGFAVFFETYSTFLAASSVYLEDIFVKPHARGRGAGLALLSRVAAIAKERGCERVEWEVLDWNQPSIEFYRKLGAAPVEGWTKYRLTGEALARLASVHP
jgi:GNAT superfamily N-acetyltransferase